MKLNQIIDGCHRDGVSLSVTDDGQLRYSGGQYAIDYWLPLLREHKAAIVASLTEPAGPIVRGCLSCRHRVRPGRSGGYCAARDDLLPAYGINHPLKKLPGDGGEFCSAWEPEGF